MSTMDKVEVLRAACCIAGLDKQVCEREGKILQKLAAEVGVGKASLAAMIERAEKDPNFYQEQFRIARGDPDRAIKTLLVLAASDHAITLEERVILQHFAQKLGIDEARFDKLMAAAEKQAAQTKPAS